MYSTASWSSFVSLAFIFIITFVPYYLHWVYSHPLAKVPGPWSAKFSPVRFLYHTWKGDLHLDHVRCHKRYGSVYRSSPSRVVFNTASAALTIYSQDRTITKANGYASHPFTRAQIPSLFNCVSASRAALKKKVIRPTTNPSATLLQNAAIEDNVETFAEIVRSSPPQDISLLAFYYALDVSSQSIFGKKFETMRNPSHRWMCKHLERGNRHMYLQLAWPRLFKVLAIFFDENRLTYPEYHEESKMFLDLCHSHLEEGLKRMGQGETIYELMKANQPKGISQDELYVDAFSFMRGGGDMVAVTIAAVFHYITQDGDVLQRLTEEVRSTFGTDETPTTGSKLESCRYLRACVDEALRMAPPGPGVFWRTSSANLDIDGVRIPAGTDFGCSIFALHYNEELFPEPLLFRPERFLEEGARDGCFVPFLRGFRSCPAQKLAYPTIELPIARLVWEFELSAVPQNIRKDPVPIKEYYQEVFGTNERGLDQLYLQVDVFGSRIEGPVLRCAPRDEHR